MKETIHRSLKLRRSRTEVEEDSSSSCSVNYSVRSLGFSNLYSYVLTRKRNAINVSIHDPFPFYTFGCNMYYISNITTH
ncbi:hypothetical protein HanIR_Chr09g0429401 [Helianthus annuus]|nr:hypothetical protein HanIR_Chr09g0429401 [Helianthus annuus]